MPSGTPILTFLPPPPNPFRETFEDSISDVSTSMFTKMNGWIYGKKSDFSKILSIFCGGIISQNRNISNPRSPCTMMDLWILQWLTVQADLSENEGKCLGSSIGSAQMGSARGTVLALRLVFVRLRLTIPSKRHEKQMMKATLCHKEKIHCICWPCSPVKDRASSNRHQPRTM